MIKKQNMTNMVMPLLKVAVQEVLVVAE